MRQLRMAWTGRRRQLGSALRDDSGASMVEFGIVLALFLLIFLGLLDFGRLGYSYVMAEKGMQRAARIAAVRPPVCDGFYALSPINERVSGSTDPLGTPCREGVCESPVEVSCTLDQATTADGSATASEIWSRIGGLMPTNAADANVRITYSPDPNGDLGFLGGPYVPVVTAELDGLTFVFISPLGEIAAFAASSSSGSLGDDIPYPSMSVSLPGEDLNIGDAG